MQESKELEKLKRDYASLGLIDMESHFSNELIFQARLKIADRIREFNNLIEILDSNEETKHGKKEL